MVLDNKIIDNIKIIEGLMFYYEIIESVEFDELEEEIMTNFILNITGEKLKVMLGKVVYNDYIQAIK